MVVSGMFDFASEVSVTNERVTQPQTTLPNNYTIYWFPPVGRCNQL